MGLYQSQPEYFNGLPPNIKVLPPPILPSPPDTIKRPGPGAPKWAKLDDRLSLYCEHGHQR